MSKFRRVYNRFAEDTSDPHFRKGYEFEGNLIEEYGQVEERNGVELERIHLYESLEDIVDGKQNDHFFEVFRAQAEKHFTYLDTIVFDGDVMENRNKNMKYSRSTMMLFTIPGSQFLIGFTLVEFQYDEKDCKPMSYWTYRIVCNAPMSYVAPHLFVVCYSMTSLDSQMFQVDQRQVMEIASMIPMVDALESIKLFADSCKPGTFEKKQSLLFFTDYMGYVGAEEVVRQHVKKLNIEWLITDYKDAKS